MADQKKMTDESLSERDQTDYVTARVEGDLGVVDAVTGETITAGGEVRLDPRRTNLATLVETGAITIAPVPENPTPRTGNGPAPVEA